MNEQIKLLTEQAKAYATDSTKDYTGNEPIGFMDYYTEKFAELIVRECVHAVENRGGMCGALASNWIKEHFGVEQ